MVRLLTNAFPSISRHEYGPCWLCINSSMCVSVCSGSAPKRPGKLMFKDRLAAKFGDGKAPGAPGGAAAPAAPKPAQDNASSKNDEADKFQAFKGTANRLK
jgi:hypothetical protein